MSASQRRNGQRVEREMVELHRGLGQRAERVPLSGASRYRGNAADVDIYPFGRDEAPLVMLPWRTWTRLIGRAKA